MQSSIWETTGTMPVTTPTGAARAGSADRPPGRNVRSSRNSRPRRVQGPNRGARTVWPDDGYPLQHEASGRTAASGTAIRHTGLPATLVAVDIVAFGDPVRNDGILREMRHALYCAMDTAFARSGIDVDGRYAWQDRGDGALYVMPPTISTAQFVDPFLAELLAELRSYNRNRAEKAQIKLRMALHLGTVHFDGYGVIGHALTRLFDLLEAPEFKTGIIALNTDLGFIASDYLYDDVIRHGPGRVDPDAYHSIEVRDGNEARRAWMYFPPGLTPPSIGMTRVPAQGRMCS